MIQKRVFIVIGTVLFFLLCSCEKDSTELDTYSDPEETFFKLQGELGFAGALEDTNAFVAILLGAETGIAYVCNGEENISEWFSGPINDHAAIYFSNSDGAKITARFSDDSFKGEISFKEGTTSQFTARVISDPNGGIYRVIDEKAVQADIKASWIVKSEDQQRGAIKTNSRFLPDMPLTIKNFENVIDESSNTINIKGNTFSFYKYKVKTPIPPAVGVPIPYPIINTSN